MAPNRTNQNQINIRKENPMHATQISKFSNDVPQQPSQFWPAEPGEIVYYVLNPDPLTGEIVSRPGVVLTNYSHPNTQPTEKDLVQILVLTCPWDDNARVPKDYAKNRSPQGLFVVMVTHGQPKQSNTWHHIFEE
jgi:hypothetical protein